MSKNNELTQEGFFKTVFPEADYDAMGDMNDEELKKNMLDEAERLLTTGTSVERAERYAYTLVDQDGTPNGKAPFVCDDSKAGKWMMSVARLLAGILSSDINLFLEVMGLPVFDTDPCGVFDIGSRELRQQLSTLPYPGISACALKALTKRALDWGTCNNPAVMDNISESTDHLKCDLSDEDNCRNLAQKYLEVLDETENHLREGKNLGLDYHSQFIIDALWGFVPHPYPENYVNCAKAIYAEAEKIPVPQLVTGCSDKDEADAFSGKVAEAARKLTEKYQVDFDGYFVNIAQSYLYYWGRHYFEVRTNQRTINSNWNARL
jgi:hypothetical protein